MTIGFHHLFTTTLAADILALRILKLDLVMEKWPEGLLEARYGSILTRRRAATLAVIG